LKTVVLDEADRMLDMGFKPDIAKILSVLPEYRQTVLFSATYPDTIEELSREYQNSPVFIGIDADTTAIPDIDQQGVYVERAQKSDALFSILTQSSYETALVFANLKTTVIELETFLLRAGISASALHGDLDQYTRNRVMAMFRNGSTRVLVATDIAARGIDLERLDLVVNYDLPLQPEVYVHRIGRTGRIGNTGRAISLCEPGERTKLDAIQLLTTVSLRFDSLAEPLELPGNAVCSLPPKAAMDTLMISGGRKEKLRPSDILGALTGEAGRLPGHDIGKIEIHEHFAYVAIAKRTSEQALRSLREGRIKGRRFKIDWVK
jgi:ATP-independent RNA helicase DbpA